MGPAREEEEGREGWRIVASNTEVQTLFVIIVILANDRRYAAVLHQRDCIQLETARYTPIAGKEAFPGDIRDPWAN